MKSARAQEVLYDSEAVLRLVASELEELRDDVTAMPNQHPSAPRASTRASTAHAAASQALQASPAASVPDARETPMDAALRAPRPSA